MRDAAQRVASATLHVWARLLVDERVPAAWPRSVDLTHVALGCGLGGEAAISSPNSAARLWWNELRSTFAARAAAEEAIAAAPRRLTLAVVEAMHGALHDV